MKYPVILVFLNDHLLVTFSQGNSWEDVGREIINIFWPGQCRVKTLKEHISLDPRCPVETRGFETKTNNIMFI